MPGVKLIRRGIADSSHVHRRKARNESQRQFNLIFYDFFLKKETYNDNKSIYVCRPFSITPEDSGGGAYERKVELKYFK